MTKVIQGIEKYFLVGVLLILIALLFTFASSFLGTLFIAAIIATTMYPIRKWMEHKIKSPTVSSLLTLILALIVIYGILAWLLFSVIGQASDAYTAINSKVTEFAKTEHQILPVLERYPRINELIEKAVAVNPISLKDVISAAGDMVGGISSFILGQTTNILKRLSLFLLHTIIFILSLFYFLRDGTDIMKRLNSLLPMPEQYKKELFGKMNKLTHAIVYGVFGAAILQGLLVGIGLAIVGVNNAAFWGAVAALLSPIPYLGTSIIWVPVMMYLAATANFGLALFLSIWGIIVVGLSDNILKPYLIGSTSALHPLAVMTVILGGAFAFGFKGLIFGPFILMLTLAFLHIYELEYKKVLRGFKGKTK